jgi:SAM-dependent methyltransferase
MHVTEGNEKDAEFCNAEWSKILLNNSGRYNEEITDWSYIYYYMGINMQGHKVLDVGCGLGHLAKHLTSIGKDVTALDFSSVALEETAKRVPGIKTIHANITQHHELLIGYDVICFAEVIEHVQDDIGVINAIPKGTEVLFSVPPYGGDGHVRYFDSIEDVHNRYDQLIKFLLVEVVGSPTSKAYFFVGHGFKS